MPQLMDIVMTGLPVAFALIGVLVLGLFLRSFLKSRRTRTWPSVTGTVISSHVRHGSTSGMGRERLHDYRSFEPVVRYRYRVAGQDHEADVISPHIQFQQFTEITAKLYTKRYRPDDRVPVYYDPAKPSDACLEPGRAGYALVLVSLTCFALAALLAGWIVPFGKAEPAADQAEEARVESAEEILARLDREAGQELQADEKAPADDPAVPVAPKVRPAAAGDHVAEKVAARLATGGDLDARDVQGLTWLHRAAASCQPDLVQALLSAKASPDLRTRAGSAALHLATTRSDCEPVARALAEAGADLDARDAQGRTPLLLAIASGRTSMAQLLVELGAGPNLAAENSRTTPLHLAAGQGDHELVRELIAKGAELERTDADDHTPLHLAAQHGRDHVVRLLLLSGADADAKDAQGRTPVELAQQNGHTQLVLRMRSVAAQNAR